MGNVKFISILHIPGCRVPMVKTRTLCGWLATLANCGKLPFLGYRVAHFISEFSKTTHCYNSFDMVRRTYWTLGDLHFLSCTLPTTMMCCYMSY